MKVETRERIIKETVYIAEDGTTFSNRHECEYYEWKSKATEVWAVSSIGSRAEPELYSTEKLARKAIGDSSSHSITKVYLDQRFWNVYEDSINIQEARKYFFEVEGYMGTDEECIKRYKEDTHE